jgi:hypothetical protein
MIISNCVAAVAAGHSVEAGLLAGGGRSTSGSVAGRFPRVETRHRLARFVRGNDPRGIHVLHNGVGPGREPVQVAELIGVGGGLVEASLSMNAPMAVRTGR